MKRLLPSILVTLMFSVPPACYAQIVSVPKPHITNPPAAVVPLVRTRNGSSTSPKDVAQALQVAMDNDIALANLQYLDNPPDGMDMIKIDHERKPEMSLFVHTIYLGG
jgi:hypothetical protein